MSFPSIDDPQLQKKIASKFRHLKTVGKEPTFRQLCFPKGFQLQESQVLVSKLMSPESPYKGMLVFHRIGAGKTCAAIQIAEAWKHKRRIVAVLPASLIGNFYKELRSECTGNEYVHKKERVLLDTLEPLSKEYQDLLNRIHHRIDKHYTILSYNKYVELAARRKLDLDNALLIVDEVQNIISEQGQFYKTIHKSIMGAPRSLRVVLLSATPIFDRPSEIALTLNLLRPKQPLPVGQEFDEAFISKNGVGAAAEYAMKNVRLFEKLVRGMVSFYPGAPEHAFPRREMRVVRCPMSSFQYQSYRAVVSQEANKTFRSILDLPNNFLIGPRIISNVAFPNRLTGEDGFNSFRGAALDKAERYSCKFARIASKVTRVRGTAFVYSNFREHGGLMSLIRLLEHRGFKNVLDHGPGRNRYALWTGEEKMGDKELIRSVFNKPENREGKLIKVILGSPAMKEGVSLMRVKQVHILEPYWNVSRLEQVIGRAVRFCSHKDVPKEERLVKVYMYLACAPPGKDEETVDEHIHRMALEKERLVGAFYEVLQRTAIDYYLFNPGRR
jgi:SNF2 family DNA or RNA helicase